MKKTLTVFALLSLFSVLASQVSISELLKWEDSIQSYLNQSDIEVFNLKVLNTDEMRELSFTYDKELSYAPGEYATFTCTGVADKATYTVFNLDCAEDEPTLWDEP